MTMLSVIPARSVLTSAVDNYWLSCNGLSLSLPVIKLFRDMYVRRSLAFVT